MTGFPVRRGQRAAFTLVELMVVVLIIAILVSLVSAAVFKAMDMIPETQTRTEISQMEAALQAMMADFNLSDPPPSSIVLDEMNPLGVGGTSAAYLQKMFGKYLGSTDWNGDGSISGTWTLNGESALVFYLGGIKNQGFSYSKSSPTPVSGQKTHGPYFPFQTSRLIPVASGFFVYIDPWQKKTGPNYATLGGSPYAFFSSQGLTNGYSVTSSYSAVPYFIIGTAPIQYMNSKSYQIISAGKDGTFGGVGWTPSSGATGAGADDQANFSAKPLGTGQQ